jgi:hypothetical protein
MENTFTVRRNTEPVEGQKHLVVNAALCDTRAVLESTLAQYESVTINAATIVTNAESREKLHRYNVSLNAADIIDVPVDAELVMKNGAFTISAGEGEGKSAVLVVNGKLTVEPGAEKAMEKYLSIQVNGEVTYPRSMEGAMACVKINGASSVYPDGAVLLKRTFIVDRVFALRAKAQQYYAARRVVLLDKNLDCAAMAAKGATFLTRTAVLAESLLTAALPMFGDDVNVEVVPDGCAYVGDDAELSDALLRRHGDKLYVSGDLMVPPRAAPLLARLSFLHVTGDVLLPESAMDAFVALGAQCGGELIAVRGVLLSGRPELKLRRASLEDAPEGLTVHACAEVHLDEDITPELIGERLTLLSCAEVHCTRAQRSAVERVARDVAEITEEDTVSFSGDFGDDDVNGAYHFCVGDPKNNKVINAASYAL